MVNKEIDERHHVDFDGKQILDEYGYPIEIFVCICAAHSTYECCCGAWDIPLRGNEDW